MVESGRAARPKILRVDARGTHQAGGKISFVSQRRLFHSIGAKRTSEPAIQLAGPSRIEANAEPGLALQLPFMQVSESMGNHDSKIVDAASVD
jgi:hypothetical protein